MRKIGLFLVLVALLALTACKPNSTITSNATNATEPAASNPTPVAPTPTAAEIVSSSIPSVCTVTTLNPTPGPTEAAVLSLFPPITEADHTLGEVTARITFLEFSDFQ